MKAYLEPSEVERLEQVATCARDRLLIRLLSHLGCRISEALGITVSDIDISQGTVRIVHLKARIALSCPRCSVRLGKAHTFCPRCGNKVQEAVAKALERRKMRTLPLDKGTMDMLREYIDRGGPVEKDGRLVLFGINRHRAWQVINRCAERARLPRLVNPETGKVHGVSPHKLRDAFAVKAIKTNDSGDGLRMLQEHLGHASFATTAKYRKIGSQEHREWYEKLWEEKP